MFYIKASSSLADNITLYHTRRVSVFLETEKAYQGAWAQGRIQDFEMGGEFL